MFMRVDITTKQKHHVNLEYRLITNFNSKNFMGNSSVGF
jgi:hypothetical protein